MNQGFYHLLLVASALEASTLQVEKMQQRWRMNSASVSIVLCSVWLNVGVGVVGPGAPALGRSPPSPVASLLPWILHWGTGVLLRCRGDVPPLSPPGHLCLIFIPQLRHLYYLHSHYTYMLGLGGLAHWRASKGLPYSASPVVLVPTSHF